MLPANVVGDGPTPAMALGVAEGTAFEEAGATDGSVGDVHAITASTRIVAQNPDRPT